MPLLLALGKDGNAYLLNRANLGGIATAIAVRRAARGAIITVPWPIQCVMPWWWLTRRAAPRALATPMCRVSAHSQQIQAIDYTRSGVLGWTVGAPRSSPLQMAN